MPGPLHAPTVLFLFPFRFRDPPSHQWVRARERTEIAVRYAEWEIVGEPELRWLQARAFNPWRRD